MRCCPSLGLRAGRRGLVGLPGASELGGERRDLSAQLRALRVAGLQLLAKLRQLRAGHAHGSVAPMHGLRSVERAPGGYPGEREHDQPGGEGGGDSGVLAEGSH